MKIVTEVMQVQLSNQPKAALYGYQMQRLPHGYTNQTVRDGVVVVKTYAGPDALARLDREYRALQLVRDHVPVPPVLDRAPHTLTLGSSRAGTAKISSRPGMPSQYWLRADPCCTTFIVPVSVMETSGRRTSFSMPAHSLRWQCWTGSSPRSR